MNKELNEKKKEILKRISIKEYRELLGFVENIYLSEYSLKILLARKCSNLFYFLLDLAREEDGGRVRRLYEQKFSGRDEPHIISNQALDYYVQALQRGEYKTILIVDDVIIHGSAISLLYDTLQDILGQHSVTIDIRAFAVNVDFLEHAKWQIFKEKSVSVHECRKITDMIVDIFGITGQPYTSYVPNIVIKSSSELGQRVWNFMSEHGQLLKDDLSNYTDVSSYVWIDPQPWKFSLFQSLRIYYNSYLEQYTIVPMVSLRPICKETLEQYGRILEDLILTDYYSKVFSDCGELSYRTIIYVVSVLWSRNFFYNYFNSSFPDGQFVDLNNEIKNFGSQILKRDKLNGFTNQDFTNIAEKMNVVYKIIDAQALNKLSPDFNVLDEKIQKILYNDEKMKCDNIIQRFLYKNGKYEDVWHNKGVIKRLDGYPLSCLMAKFDNFDKKQIDKETICAQIINAIEHGRGSIITKMYEQQYFVSLLRAGERNYKYAESRYFSFMYGLFQIERISLEKGEGALQYKKKFMQKYADEIVDDRCDKEELNELCNTNISNEYMSVLIRDAWNYPKRDELNASLRLVEEIMN